MSKLKDFADTPRQKACKKYYEKNKEACLQRSRLRNKIQSKQRRIWFNDYKETLICDRCGFSFKGRPECCDFHHIDPSTKRLQVSNMILTHRIETLITEVKKCVPLCRNCHQTITTRGIAYGADSLNI